MREHSPEKAAARVKKKLLRRAERDYSQRLRLAYQLTFLALNAWMGTRFYLWVRHFETSGGSPYVSRPAGVEGWLPIAGMMNLKYFLVTGQVPAPHPAAMFLLITFLAMAFLFRKAFCSWLCPVGTVSEYLGKLGKKLFGRNFQLARWADIPAARFEVSAVGVFRVGGLEHVGECDRGVHAQPIRHCRRCGDAELLSLYWTHRADRVGRASDRVGAGAELLVPVPVPVRRAAGDQFTS